MRENYNDLLAFIAVAREHSFTRAAAQLGISPSALSHTIRGLETRLGLRLLTRTTRSVSLTEAGANFYESIAPHFEGIDSELSRLGELREHPTGTVRISATDHSTRTVLWPKLSRVLHDYPDIRIEIFNDYGITDIVSERYDAGVRTGDMLAENMVAVRIGPDLRMCVVGTPAYLAAHPAPREPAELSAHACINLRLPTYGSLLPWEFVRQGAMLKIRVDGQWVFNSSYPMLDAALEGYGLAYLPEDMVQEAVGAGKLVPVLEDWMPTYTGYHLYYPSRRHASTAFSVVLAALRGDG